MRRFEFSEGRSNKFWEVGLNGARLSTRWGKLGTKGQEQTKSLPSADRAKAAHDSLINEKLAKGYREVGAAAPESTSKVVRAAKKQVSSHSTPSTGADFGADYLTRFHAMVSELKSHPEIRVLQFNVNPPASKEDVAAVEKHLGTSLSPAIKSFYKAADGLQLRWIHARHPSIDNPKVRIKGGKLTPGAILGGNTIEHALVNLLPIRQTFVSVDWKNSTWFDHMEEYEPVEFEGEKMSSLEFHKSLRLFDLYYFYDLAALLVRPGNANPLVFLGTDHGADWSDSCPDDKHKAKKHPSFEDYLETVLANRGIIKCRENIRPRKYWDAHRVTLKKQINGLDLVDDGRNLVLRGALPDFPLSNKPGHKQEVKREALLSHLETMAGGHAALTSAALEKAVAKHRAFLESGGAGGSFTNISVHGMPMCLYGAKGKKGKQLSLAMTKVAPGASASGANLTYANLSGSVCRHVVFRKARLDHSVALDCSFDGADFTGASLNHVDFTGSSLKGCSFRDAKLDGTDFENTDCTGADFFGADLTGSRFPGAILIDVNRERPLPRSPLQKVREGRRTKAGHG